MTDIVELSLVQFAVKIVQRWDWRVALLQNISSRKALKYEENSEVLHREEQLPLHDLIGYIQLLIFVVQKVALKVF